LVKENKTIPTRFEHGDILEIPLSPYLDCFGYGKYIDYSKSSQNFEYFIPQRLIAYNYFSATRIHSISQVITMDYLCNPLYIVWTTSLKDLLGWRIVGKQHVSEVDFVPSYVREPNIAKIKVRPSEYSDLQWFSYLDTKSSLNKGYRRELFPWRNVKHLEFGGHTSLAMIPFRIYLEWCKINYMDFDISRLDKNEWYAIYLRCCDIPIYSDIPKQFKQTPIPLDCDLPWKEMNEIYFNYSDWYINQGE
jgi:hypothetical protein